MLLHIWVDAAYAVHSNARSQTEVTKSMGNGILHAKSNTQKLNSKSSTEAEIVGTSDYCPSRLWFAMFITKHKDSK